MQMRASEDVFNQFDKTRPPQNCARGYAYTGGLLQSTTWIRQLSKPLKFGAKAGRNECSAYIYWGEGEGGQGAGGER